MMCPNHSGPHILSTGMRCRLFPCSAKNPSSSHSVFSACLECAMRKGEFTNRSEAGGRAPAPAPQQDVLLHPSRLCAAQTPSARTAFLNRPIPIQSTATATARRPTDYSCHLACHLILAHPSVRVRSRRPPHPPPSFFTRGAGSAVAGPLPRWVFHLVLHLISRLSNNYGQFRSTALQQSKASLSMAQMIPRVFLRKGREIIT